MVVTSAGTEPGTGWPPKQLLMLVQPDGRLVGSCTGSPSTLTVCVAYCEAATVAWSRTASVRRRASATWRLRLPLAAPIPETSVGERESLPPLSPPPPGPAPTGGVVAPSFAVASQFSGSDTELVSESISSRENKNGWTGGAFGPSMTV